MIALSVSFIIKKLRVARQIITALSAPIPHAASKCST